jgi:hypothetical protein
MVDMVAPTVEQLIRNLMPWLDDSAFSDFVPPSPQHEPVPPPRAPSPVDPASVVDPDSSDPTWTFSPMFKPAGSKVFHRRVAGLGVVSAAAPNRAYTEDNFPDRQLIDFANSTLSSGGFQVLSDSISIPAGAFIRVSNKHTGFIDFVDSAGTFIFSLNSGPAAFTYMPTFGRTLKDLKYCWEGIQTVSVPDLPRFLELYDREV